MIKKYKMEVRRGDVVGYEEVEAVQWLIGRKDMMCEFTEGKARPTLAPSPKLHQFPIEVKTHYGWTYAAEGDYIVKREDGAILTMSTDCFEKMCTLITEPEPVVEVATILGTEYTSTASGHQVRIMQWVGRNTDLVCKAIPTNYTVQIGGLTPADKLYITDQHGVQLSLSLYDFIMIDDKDNLTVTSLNAVLKSAGFKNVEVEKPKPAREKCHNHYCISYDTNMHCNCQGSGYVFVRECATNKLYRKDMIDAKNNPEA